MNFDVNMAKLTRFGVGGKATIVFYPENLDDLVKYIKCSEYTLYPVGLGSNILVRDGGLDGVVIKLNRGFDYIRIDGNSIYAGGGCTLNKLVRTACINGLGGLEFYCGIPGTVGGAIAMNAGANGSDTAAVLRKVICVDPYGNIRVMYNDDIGYVYRGHSLGSGWIFVEAMFQCVYTDPYIIEQRIEKMNIHRRLTQPITGRTCGSTFKNPLGLSAWKLIEQAGCRGLRVGGAEISQKHCNFLMNVNCAIGRDIEDLGNEVRRRVYISTGIMLDWEIKIIGKTLPEDIGLHYCCNNFKFFT